MMARSTKDITKRLSRDHHPAVVVRVVEHELGTEQAEVLTVAMNLVRCPMCTRGQIEWRGGVTTCWLCEGRGLARKEDVQSLEESKR